MDTFKLPSSSYEELIKIIKAYGRGKVGIPISLDDLIKSSGMGKTILSKNNAFLVQVGLITKGTKKAPTEICHKLSQSYEMKMKDKTSLIWRGICENDAFLSSMISMVNLKGKISKTEYVKHIVYSANCGNGPNYKAGAAALIEIFKLTDAIVEDAGEIRIKDVSRREPAKNYDKKKNSVTEQQIEDMVQDDSNEMTFYIQQYTCESGQIAKIIIPDDATEDDLLGFRDMLNIALRRRFKIKSDK